MARYVELNIQAFESAVRRMPQAVTLGARRAFDSIRGDWADKSEAITPKDTGHLRRETEAEIEGNRLDNLQIALSNSAESDEGFNYAYYIHEQNFGGKTPKNGMEKKFLDKPLEENETEYARKLEQEIQAQLRRAGW